MRWGFLGYGGIAPVFAESLFVAKGQQLTAIASKSNAGKLKKRIPATKIFARYEDLLQFPEIEIVYISTTHNFHFENVMDALEHNKHVLCEKPLGISFEQVKEMTAFAKKKKLFLMEALWTRFLPAYIFAMDLVASGKIGDIKMVRSDFSLGVAREDNGRLWNPQLAGGSTLDLGVYNIALLNDIFKKLPESVDVQANILDTGVEESLASQLRYDSGAIAQCFSGLGLLTNWDAYIFGLRGWIHLKNFFKCQELTYCIEDKVKQLQIPFTSTGYYHEIMHVAACIKDGQTQSKVFPHEESMMSAQLVEMLLSKARTLT